MTVGASLLVALINAVVGTITAWVLIRDEFVGKPLVNALIDLPFAIPTVVAGLVLLVIYGPDSPIGVNIAFTRWASCWRCCSSRCRSSCAPSSRC